MKIIADTNILVRFLTQDDKAQFTKVKDLFSQVDEIIIPTHVFCEIAWVLSFSYKIGKDKISEIMNALVSSNKIISREDEIEAGLEMLENGGDFADGVNEYSGRQMANGQSVFASFDKKAVRIFNERGISAMVPQ